MLKVHEDTHKELMQYIWRRSIERGDKKQLTVDEAIKELLESRKELERIKAEENKNNVSE